jgi:hypothetical protein
MIHITKEDNFVWKVLSKEEATAILSVGKIDLYAIHDDDSETLIEGEDHLKSVLIGGFKVAIEVGHIPTFTLKPQIVKAYLDYVNNYLTVDAFAQAYGLDYSSALSLIETGNKLNNNPK